MITAETGVLFLKFDNDNAMIVTRQCATEYGERKNEHLGAIE